ncbi:MAG: hypothetical protein PHV06_10560 [bacterium]|nr:hypothetical protein [bacterium]
MVLKRILRFEKKEREFYELFIIARTCEDYESYETFQKFHLKLEKFPPDPKDKIEEKLYNEFLEAYVDADRSVQRIYLYHKTGEPMALIYSNLFSDKFLKKREKLIESIGELKQLLSSHIKGENK